jgi:hypothetical protein
LNENIKRIKRKQLLIFISTTIPNILFVKIGFKSICTRIQGTISKDWEPHAPPITVIVNNLSKSRPHSQSPLPLYLLQKDGSHALETVDITVIVEGPEKAGVAENELLPVNEHAH